MNDGKPTPSPNTSNEGASEHCGTPSSTESTTKPSTPAPKKKNRYHHGDLKQALLTAAEELLKEKGSDGLTMRDLSKRVGVSRTAAYHHFRDRADLLAALASQGLNELMAQSEAVMTDQTLPPHEQLETLMLTYVRYAANHPEKYGLMVGNDLLQKHTVPELQQLARTSFRRYVGWITQFCEQGVFDSRDPLRTAQMTWATLHGVSRLLMDGIFARRSDMEEIIQYSLLHHTRPPQ